MVGWLMWVIAAISVLMVACVLYGFVMLTHRHVAPDPLREEIVHLLRTGAVGEVRRVVDARPCALSSVVGRVLEYLRDDPELIDTARLKDVLETEGARHAEALQAQQQYLMDIVGIAPMVGLLGTVFGMLKAFSGVAHELANAKPVVLSEGISMALLTTAFGLIVAIPAMGFHSLFRRKVAILTASLERAASDVFAACLNLRNK
jgi:biopolymer transport protein ExbB